MKQNLFFILFLLASCTPTKQEKIIIHNLDHDFPIEDTLSFVPIKTFEITTGNYGVIIKDSVLFILENNADNFGHCYDLKNGKQLSAILGRGRAANEITDFSKIEFWKDSITFLNNGNNIMKTFAINDILTKSFGERDFSTITLPDSVTSSNFTKIDNNKLFGLDFNFTKSSMYFTSDGTNFSFFGEIPKEIFEMPSEIDIMKMKLHLSAARLATNRSKVVMAVDQGILLQIIDTEKKTIDFNRYYNKINATGTIIINEFRTDFRTNEIRCDDENIYCFATKKDRKKSKETGKNEYDSFIFVFDWKLNPVKKYFLDVPIHDAHSYFSHDGKSFYYLTDGDEKQELYEGKLKL